MDTEELSAYDTLMKVIPTSSLEILKDKNGCLLIWNITDFAPQEVKAWFWFEEGKQTETREPHFDCCTLFVLSKEACVTELASRFTSSPSLGPVRGHPHTLLICDSICYTIF